MGATLRTPPPGALDSGHCALASLRSDGQSERGKPVEAEGGARGGRRGKPVGAKGESIL